MAVSIGKWSLFWRYERGEPSEEFEAFDPRSAHLWLRTLRTHRDSLPALRRLLAQDGLSDLWRFTDEAVVELTGRKVEAGQIRVLVQPEEDHTSHTQASLDNNTVPFQREERTSRPSSSASKAPVVEDTFPDDAHLVAIAGVLQEAARSGAPF
jgi:hypothetical protein